MYDTFNFDFERFLSGNNGFLEKTTFLTFNPQPLHYTKSSQSSITISLAKDNFNLPGHKTSTEREKRLGRLLWMSPLCSIYVLCLSVLQKTKATEI